MNMSINNTWHKDKVFYVSVVFQRNPKSLEFLIIILAGIRVIIINCCGLCLFP